MAGFVETRPTTDAYRRSVILFGRDCASYEFALGKSLLEAAEREQNFVSLEELAEPYARNMVEHLQKSEHQGTSSSSRFLEVCRKLARREIAKDELLARTARLGFANVLDAFRNVNQAEIPVRFFVDERGRRRGISLTDEVFALKEDFQYGNLCHEVEARWRLVSGRLSTSARREVRHGRRASAFPARDGVVRHATPREQMGTF